MVRVPDSSVRKVADKLTQRHAGTRTKQSRNSGGVAVWQATMLMSSKSSHVKVCKIRDQSAVMSSNLGER
jgi:hypothetical protein